MLHGCVSFQAMAHSPEQQSTGGSMPMLTQLAGCRSLGDVAFTPQLAHSTRLLVGGRRVTMRALGIRPGSDQYAQRRALPSADNRVQHEPPRIGHSDHQAILLRGKAT